MSAYVDLEFKFIDHLGSDGGFYDLTLTEEGGFGEISGLNTALKMSLLEEERASVDEIPVPQNRRGWHGNALIGGSGFSIGGKLWLLFQSRLTNQVINEGIDIIDNALQWLVDEDLAESVKTSLDRVSRGFPIYIIDIAVDKSVVKSFVFDLWSNTVEEVIQ